MEKETGNCYAVKIIDLTGDKDSDRDHREELRIATKKEINVLRMCAQHLNIIELHNTFESPTFIFLVFELFVFLFFKMTLVNTFTLLQLSKGRAI